MSYKINKFKYFFERIDKINFFKYQTSFDIPYLIGVGYHFILRYLKIHPKKIFSQEDPKPRKIDRFNIFWLKVNNKTFFEGRRFIFPINYIGKIIVFLDIKSFILYSLYIPIKITLVTALLIHRPHNIVFLFSDLIKYGSTSVIIQKNETDQSKTIMIKGD